MACDESAEVLRDLLFSTLLICFVFRSGEADTSIEILTSFDQLTLGIEGRSLDQPSVQEKDDEMGTEMKGDKSKVNPPKPPNHLSPKPQQSAIESLVTQASVNSLKTSITLSKTKAQSKEEQSTTGKLFSSSSLSSSAALTKAETDSSGSSPTLSQPVATSALTSPPSSTTTTMKKREKKESFFCDFKSIPKFPKISSTKSDFHLPPSIFAAAAAVIDAETNATGDSKAQPAVRDAKMASSPVPSMTPQRRLLNGDMKTGENCMNHSFSAGAAVDAKSSDEYDFVSSPER